MCIVISNVICTRCFSPHASYEHDCVSGERKTRCSRCGYMDEWIAEYDDENNLINHEHQVTEPAGVLTYTRTCCRERHVEILFTAKDIEKAEQRIRKDLHTGQVDPSSVQLNRWDDKTRRVEMLVGNIGFKQDNAAAELPESDDGFIELCTSRKPTIQ